VKKLKDLKGNANWVALMRKRRRKTLVVCPECHSPYPYSSTTFHILTSVHSALNISFNVLLSCIC
ncbi:MAG: hypothetical protein EOM40_09970, partial [Clostridia bacterium]|nr:hypothetical protein [Clostridia bacterium]